MKLSKIPIMKSIKVKETIKMYAPKNTFWITLYLIEPFSRKVRSILENIKKLLLQK